MPRGYESRGTTRSEAKEVTWDLPAHEDWHPIAVRLYESARSSGQSKHWQDSDWSLFYSLCDDLSYVKNQGNRRSAEMVKGVYTALSSLGLTEGDRRRMHVELAEAQKKARLRSVDYMNEAARDLGVED